MKISVWDTYVKRSDGLTMHFDILVPENVNEREIIFQYGMDYLKNKPFDTGQITSNECRFCHIEYATDDMKNDISQKGYSIIEMENCY